MRIYISGRITGDGGYREKFDKAERLLKGAGHVPVNPCRFVRDGTDWEAAMRRVLPFMLRSGGVALLPGWRKSKGAKLEARLAQKVGIPVKPIEEWTHENQ